MRSANHGRSVGRLRGEADFKLDESGKLEKARRATPRQNFPRVLPRLPAARHQLPPHGQDSNRQAAGHRPRRLVPDPPRSFPDEGARAVLQGADAAVGDRRLRGELLRLPGPTLAETELNFQLGLCPAQAERRSPPRNHEAFPRVEGDPARPGDEPPLQTVL